MVEGLHRLLGRGPGAGDKRGVGGACQQILTYDGLTLGFGTTAAGVGNTSFPTRAKGDARAPKTAPPRTYLNLDFGLGGLSSQVVEGADGFVAGLAGLAAVHCVWVCV